MDEVPLDFAVVTRPGGVLALRGELDMASLPQLEAAVAGMRQNGNRLIVDLRELSFLDSMGLEFLIQLDADVELVVVRGPRAVHRLFDVMEMGSVLTIVDAPPEG
jgi:anti-anti-sigma factor